MVQLILSSCFCLAAVASRPAETVTVNADKPFIPTGRPLVGLVITIDAGHGGFGYAGGYSGSARGVKSGVVENDLNMMVAAELWHYLRRSGADVHMTRWDDRKVTMGDTGRAEELGARVKVAVDSRSHLFVSLHHNAAPRATADGVVVLTWPTDSAGQDQPLEHALEKCLREEVEKKVHFTEHFGPWIDKHPLVAGSDIPSATVEFGFLSNADFDEWVTQRGHHRDEARGVYNGIVRMWEEHRADLQATRSKLFPNAASRPASAPMSLEEDGTRRIADVRRALWPVERRPETAAEVQWLIDQYRQRVLGDVSLFHLKTTVEKDGSGWLIHAATNYPRLIRSVERILRRAGCESMRMDVKELPSAAVGEKKFGVVQVPMAISRAEANDTSTANTELLLGERVMLLDQSADGVYLLLHAGDGYIGWVRQDAILRMDEKGFAEWEEAELATIKQDYMLDDFRMPAGSRLPVLSQDAKAVTLRLPMGVRATKGELAATVPVGFVAMAAAVPAGLLAVREATEYLTTPYVFGAKSRIGIDCSGLTGVSYSTVGLRLPRDAYHQITVGQLAATPWHMTALRPGDLIFFCDETGRVSHTGLSLGGMRFIHSSAPEVQVSSFDRSDPLFVSNWLERFSFAKRPLP